MFAAILHDSASCSQHAWIVISSLDTCEKSLMPRQTFTIREAETQLHDLVKQAQATHQPVILTSEETTAPVAVLTPLFSEQSNDAQIASHRLEMLENVLQLWQQFHNKPEVSADYAQLFQSQLRLLAQSELHLNPTFSALLMLLRLAVRQASSAPLLAQFEAFRFGLNTLKSVDLNANSLSKVDEMLLSSGIDVQADFGDEELLKHYVEAS